MSNEETPEEGFKVSTYVRIKEDDLAQIFEEKEQELKQTGDYVSANAVMKEFIRAYPRLLSLEEENETLKTDLQQERQQRKAAEEKIKEVESKLLKTLEEQVKDLKAKEDMTKRIKELEEQLNQQKAKD